MARFRNVWNNYRILQAEKGTYRSVYHPGAPDEWVTVIGPGEERKDIKTPGLGDWGLAAEGGEVVVRYLQIEGAERVERAIRTGILCGQPVGNAGAGPAGAPGERGSKGEKGDSGPPGLPGATTGGEQVDEATMQRIAALTAEQVLLGGPAGDHYGLAENARFGTRHQENISVMFTNQAFWQEVIKAIDTAAAGLVAGGYQPKLK